jgi:hypothetical protein
LGYLDSWKVLEEMVADFRENRVPIPEQIINDLKSARTLIKVLNADPSKNETVQKVEECFFKVESYLGSEGEKIFGKDYVEKWIRRLNEAGKKPPDDKEEENRFFPGVPREQRWIRVKLSAELTEENVKSLAKSSKLSFNVQDGYMIVYGEDEHVKKFVRKMARMFKTKT